MPIGITGTVAVAAIAAVVGGRGYGNLSCMNESKQNGNRPWARDHVLVELGLV